MSGKVICCIHGKQNPIHVCRHIYDQLTNFNKIEAYDFPIFRNHICQDCYFLLVKGRRFEKYSFDDLETMSDEVSNEVANCFDKIPKLTACPQCLDLNLLSKNKYR